MNNGPLLFLGVLITLATSFWGLIIAPQIQFGRQQPRLIEATGEYYPIPRPGQAERGADVYRSLGCVECHSQQVRQTGVHFDVWVTELTTNLPVAVAAIAKAQSRLTSTDLTRSLAQSLPARIATGLDVTDAQDLAKKFTDGGATAEAALVVLGPDIERNWGQRMSVGQDYIREYPVQLGQLRLGPDLAGYGSRQTNINLILMHLFEPARTMPGSMMPPYRFLFEKQSYSKSDSDPEGAIVTTPATDEHSGLRFVPKEDALALAAYLMSLKTETSLIEAPAGKVPSRPAPATTNAPGQPPAPAPAP
jgi:cbb3-type cytochrome oxidase cytochrome c subunit